MTIEEVIAKRRRLRVTQAELAARMNKKKWQIIAIEQARANDLDLNEEMSKTIDLIARERLNEPAGAAG